MLERELWPFEDTPADKYPLLLHYHPLVIYRHQVSKQADAVLAMVQCRYLFTQEEKAKALAYYEQITTHDSTLSAGSFAILAAECEDMIRARQYFEKTVLTDLENLYNNSDHGLHMAALANSWSVVAFGFAGMQVQKGSLHFNPKYDAKLGPYSFQVMFRGRQLAVRVEAARVSYELLSGGRDGHCPLRHNPPTGR